jgi:hypothetical protein
MAGIGPERVAGAILSKKKKKPQDFGLGASLGIGAEQPKPSPSPAVDIPQSAGTVVDTTIRNIVAGYQKASGQAGAQLPSPAKVIQLVDAGATGEPDDFAKMFSVPAEQDNNDFGLGMGMGATFLPEMPATFDAGLYGQNVVDTKRWGDTPMMQGDAVKQALRFLRGYEFDTGSFSSDVERTRMADLYKTQATAYLSQRTGNQYQDTWGMQQDKDLRDLIINRNLAFALFGSGPQKKKANNLMRLASKGAFSQDFEVDVLMDSLSVQDEDTVKRTAFEGWLRGRPVAQDEKTARLDYYVKFGEAALPTELAEKTKNEFDQYGVHMAGVLEKVGEVVSAPAKALAAHHRRAVRIADPDRAAVLCP